MKVLFLILVCQSFLAFANIAGDNKGIDFRLQNKPSCAGIELYCEVTEPKDWSAEEALFISTDLEKLKNNGLSSFLNRVLNNGISEISRVSYGFALDIYMDHPIKRATTPFAYTQKDPASITFTNLFFEYPVKEDPLTNVSLKSLTLLHELAHAYDIDNEISKSAYFLDKAGFDSTSIYHSEYMKVSPEELANVKEQMIKLNEQGKPVQAEYLQRTFAMNYGLPRVYSMTSPAEAFADLVAHIYYDKSASQYVDPTLYAFIKQKVLKGAPSTFY